MSDVSRILSQVEQGDPTAAEKLLPLVYDALRKLAAAKLAQEKPGHTLQATALVHEAYLRLVGGLEKGRPEPGESCPNQALGSSLPSAGTWDHRGHFFAAAAESMRRILIEQARRKTSLKAGGTGHRESLSQVAEIAIEDSSEPLDLLALDDAVKKLERQSPRKAEVVKLRFFSA